MAKRQNPEQQIQRAIVQHLQLRGVDDLVFWHTPQGAHYGPRQGAIMKSMGVRAGVPDLLICHDQKLHLLELKANGRKATPSQEQFFEDIKTTMRTAYGGGWVCNGVDHALQVLFNWGIIR